MAVLETIRVKIGWLITLLIAVALLSFIVDFNSLSSAVQSSSSKYAVGKINGSKIQYKDFQDQVEYQTRIAEFVNQSSISSDEQQKQIRNAAWQHFINERLFLKNAEMAGIEVGQDEMIDLTQGEMVSPIIAYDRYFGSPDGKVNKEQMKEYLDYMGTESGANLKMYWSYLYNTIYEQQNYSKYLSLFTASNYSNGLVVKNQMEGNNISANAEVVMVPYGYQKDTTITVSDSEIKAYYNEHKKLFKQVANRDVAYAVFEVVPSADDIAAARKSIEDVYEEFAGCENVKNFIMRNSETAFSTYFYKKGELNTINAALNDFVFSDEKGTSPIVDAGEKFYAVKVVDTRMMPDSVLVNHILIQNDNALADSLMTVLKGGESFSTLAAMYSADQNPNVAVPGELGWMTQAFAAQIPGFESVFTAKINQPFFIDTQYGRHIVKVTKATAPILKKQVAILSKSAVPSKATMNEAYAKANGLATKAAGKLDNLIAAAKEDNVYLYNENVTEATDRYNVAERAKEVTRWIFDADKGEVSNVISPNQNVLIVVGVKDTHKEGYKSVAEAKSIIEPIIYSRKRSEKVVAEVAEKIASCTTMEEVAKALDQTVMTRENVTFASMDSYDNEPALLGAIAGAEEGKIAGPVQGMMGIYVVKVTGRETASFYTEDDAKQMDARKNQYAAQMLVPVMFESSNSVDNRERFY